MTMLVRFAFRRDALPNTWRFNSGVILIVVFLLSLRLSETAIASEAAALLPQVEDAVQSAGKVPVDFNRDIRPILSEHCLPCHGPDESTREAGLRLDQRQLAIETGAIAVGDPNASEMIKRIESNDPDLVMPPPASGRSLDEKKRLQLREWIQMGADYDQHWAFEPISKFEPPEGNPWSDHPIDRFVLRQLSDRNLQPNPQALPWELLRRVSLDLTGLPPSEELASEFLADPSDASYERLVDQLLSQDSFGEHWARMWLDLARYADTKGYEKDRERIIWRYRDWVIDAFNADMPYDQFTLQQLAGDLLPDATMEQRLATAFHRNTMENEEGGTDDEEFRVAAVKDRVDTTMQVWMGLTAGCAKCHSHKYDPITQTEYYQLYAFFNQTADADRGQPTMPSPTKSQQRELEQLEAAMGELQSNYRKSDQASEQAFSLWKDALNNRRLWTSLRLAKVDSKHLVEILQSDEGDLDVVHELPEKDTWTLTLEIPTGMKVTSIRLDTYPKPDGGKWSDKNVALRELTGEWVDAEGQVKSIAFANPRADFSQRGWEVSRAIDGKPDAGWAFSPKAGEPHCSIFDLQEPIEANSANHLRLTLDQEYGQGLLLDKFRISVSGYPTQWLIAELEPESNLREIYRRHVDPRTVAMAKQIDELRHSIRQVRDSIPSIPVMQELATDRRRETRLQTRGNFLDPGDLVTTAVPSQFGAFPEGAPLDRMGLAMWLFDESNPLTARVSVNRFWARLFGRGIVETEEDFGTQGMIPTHPELLDWLSVYFRENQWSVKQLLKTMVMSKTYQQSSQFTDEKYALDPRNEWLSRGPRFRLSAETVRDQALAVAGLLTHQLGGPSVMPPQPDGIWKSTYSGEDWKNATGPDRYRRAIYTYKKRTSPYPAMTTFDSGSGEVCQIRRIRTNTPLQALVTLNDVAFVEAAGGLSNRMQESATEPRQQIANGFRMVLVRDATEIELDRLMNLYETLQFGEANGKQLLNYAGIARGDARLVTIANVLLNLDETLTKP